MGFDWTELTVQTGKFDFEAGLIGAKTDSLFPCFFKAVLVLIFIIRWLVLHQKPSSNPE